jgi:hypothetical protein
MKKFIYTATLEFEAESADEADELLNEYLENGDTDSSLYSPESWMMTLSSGEEIEEE